MLLLATVSYFINYISNGFIYNYLFLSPNAVVDQFQIWRLITFPFAGTSLESYILFFITFTVISPNLEKSFKIPYYLFFMGLLICLQGAMSIILHYNVNIGFFGTEGISFFVITLFVMMNFKKKLQFSRMNPVRTSSFGLALFVFWSSSTIIHSYIFNNFNIIYLSGFSAIYGILSAVLIFFELKIIEFIKNKKIISKDRKIEIPKPEELAMAYSQPQIENSRINEILKESKYIKDYFDERDFTEEQLNRLLDKVSEIGFNSLTSLEQEYLREYSNRIK